MIELWKMIKQFLTFVSSYAIINFASATAEPIRSYISVWDASATSYTLALYQSYDPKAYL